MLRGCCATRRKLRSRRPRPGTIDVSRGSAGPLSWGWKMTEFKAALAVRRAIKRPISFRDWSLGWLMVRLLRVFFEMVTELSRDRLWPSTSPGW